MSIGDFIMKVTSTRRSPRVVRMNMTGSIMRSQEPKMKMRGSESDERRVAWRAVLPWCLHERSAVCAAQMGINYPQSSGTVTL